MRRQFNLLPQDEAFLELYDDRPWETMINGSQWVLIHEFPTHEGYNHEKTSIAILLTPGYPQTALDMVYVYPPLARKDGKPIRQANAHHNVDGKNWQRWSRHRTSQNPWRPGEDSLETHIFLIEDWFTREFER